MMDLLSQFWGYLTGGTLAVLGFLLFFGVYWYQRRRIDAREARFQEMFRRPVRPVASEKAK